MSAPFRISTPDPLREKPADGTESNEGFRQYLDRLLKMIPAEIVGLYLIGKGFVPTKERIAGMVWLAICFVLVILVRWRGTADPETQKGPQPAAVAISAVAFLIWAYSLAWPFDRFEGVYIPYVGSLAVLLWSFGVPMFYKGEIER